MKYLPLVWASIMRKPTRAILTLLSVMLAFTLFGLTIGMNATFAKFQEDARDDLCLHLVHVLPAGPAAPRERQRDRSHGQRPSGGEEALAGRHGGMIDAARRRSSRTKDPPFPGSSSARRGRWGFAGRAAANRPFPQMSIPHA